MYNLLEAIWNIAQLENTIVDEIKTGNNRVNNMGEGLETFVKNAFANCLHEKEEATRIKQYSAAFSWEGSKTRIPDLILKGSDAIEVKKVESINTDLQLNSSFPKAVLDAKTATLKKECLDCEDSPWQQKDILYVVGHVPKKTKKLASLWLVYGDVYAAGAATYTDVKNLISHSILASGLAFSETNEIGRINNVDALKITSLRIRGMWLLSPPKKVFSYIYDYNKDLDFQLVAILSKEKYDSFDKNSRTKIEEHKEIEIKDIAVKNPNNPVKMIAAKLITITAYKNIDPPIKKIKSNGRAVYCF